MSRLELLGHQVLLGDREGNIPEKVDVLYDLASYGNIYGQDDREQILKVNVERLRKLLNQKDMYDKAVITSTSSVTMMQTTDYALSKANAEDLAKQYGATIIRPYTIYGPGDNPKHLIPTIFRSCMRGDRMNLDSSGYHDYIYVDDLVDIYLDPPSKLVEAGTGTATSNLTIFLMIEEIVGHKANLDGYIYNSRTYDSKDWKAPKPIKENMIQLEEGLRRIYDYEQRTQEANN